MRRDRHGQSAYAKYSTIAGALRSPQREDAPVAFRRVLSGGQRATLAFLVTVNVVAAAVFLGWLVAPAHIPVEQTLGGIAVAAGKAGFVAIILIELARMAQSAALWVFAGRARDPLPVEPPSGLRVAVLTTIVPSKEPVELVLRTLAAMREIVYDGQVDVWILDEGDDPDVRRAAASLGVHHFSRKGRPEYNQPSGPFRAKSKAGNHNAWRAEHEHRYDVVAQMDPDHVPLPDFLQRTLGYFRDPDVGFAVAPQVYGNLDAGFVARASAAQAYLFHGIVQRGGNGLDAPLLIGTNHLYRPAAWSQIGGYQDSIIEDHLTSMHLHAAVNPATGNRWKGVYTPDILAVGEGPTSWTDYFNQQKRWAYGIWEIMMRHSSALLRRLTWRQRVSYGLLQAFYPSVGLLWVLGNLLTVAYLTWGITSINVDVRTWVVLWGATVAAQLNLFAWLRRFNLAEHERAVSGLDGVALSMFAGPVYVAAGAAALARRGLVYAVTAKGDLTSPDTLGTFRQHLGWAAVVGGALAASVLLGNTYGALRGWAVVTLCAALVPVGMFVAGKRPRPRGAADPA